MSWFQSLRDDFTLRPFELQQTHSDSTAMASGPPEAMANQEPAEVVEECSGKKKSKFQTFKKFFARKKRKEPPAAGADAGLKASQSTDNVSKTSENNTLTRSEKDKGSGSKISLGSKALSHDSVFVSDSSEANEALGASQDSIHGKVKSLQLQLKQAIRIGSPPSIMCVKRTEDAGTMSEDDGLPCSPPEYTTHNTVMNQTQRNSSISLEGLDSDDDQLSCATSSRAMSPLVVPGDFSQPASPFGCLDNSAAKHKLGLRYKACNKRKPMSRVEMKAEGDSVVENPVNTSITEASVEQEQQKTTEVVSDDKMKPKVEEADEEEKEEAGEEAEEEAEEEEEEEQPQNSKKFLSRDNEEREEREDGSDSEQDVSHGPDTSCLPELCLSEEEALDAQPPPSSKPSSRASSPDSLRARPEPLAGPREHLLDPPGVTYGGEENRAESDLEIRGEEDGIQENREEESSFLQEVLSSLKTPLVSCSLGIETQGIVQEQEEEEKVKEKEREYVEVEEGEEVKEEEAEVDEPVSHQAAPAGSLLSDQNIEKEEEAVASSTSAPSCQDVEEEQRVDDEDAESAVEQFSLHGQKEEGEEEEAEEVEPEQQNDILTVNTVNEAEQEGRRGGGGEEEEEEEESEGEEAIELEKEPEMDEEGQEKREEGDEQIEVEQTDAKESVEEAVEVTEEDRDDAEEMTEVPPGSAGDGGKITVGLQEADQGVDIAAGDDTMLTPQHTNDDEIPTELGDQVITLVHESQAASRESFEEEREDEEETEDGVEIDHAEQEEDGETNQPDTDQTEQDVEQEGVEISHLDISQQVEKDQTEATEQAHVSSKPSSLSLPESYDETPLQESGTTTPSKTSTTTLHINLCSPSSEKVTSFFQQSPTAAYPKESETPLHAVEATEQNTVSTEQNTVSTEEKQADTLETVKEEQKSAVEEAKPPAAENETISQLPRGSDQSKARFTITPAWQRSLSVEEVKENLTPPSSPPACVSSSSSTATAPRGMEVEATTKKDPEVKAEPASSAQVEVVLSPGRVRNAGATTAKPQSSTTSPPSPVKAQASAAASTEGKDLFKESAVIVEGNPDNPFGVRLRKTSVLHRHSSEEDSTEHAVESPAQPTSCKVDLPQPISVKPSISQPVSNKPALPKKPDVHGDSAVKNKRISEPAAARGGSAGSDSPSWISVAKQKQKIYKENSLEEITVKKEEQEKKSSLPMYVSSAVSREHSKKTAEATGKVSSLETSNPSVSAENEARRALSPPTPVPFQPPKSQSLPCPVPPKPQVPPVSTKPPPQRSLSPPTPVPVPQKSPSCTSSTSLSKTATSSKTPQPHSTTVTSPPFSSRTTPEKSSPRALGLSSQIPSSQRGLPPPALPQDEPPWMALAKKKAKAWSEMPQIVQ
uniref:probable serine/threonine-protein kinase kinX isoform X2 n=1 Tax=Scatophagus argus TaxID=75038 RepID=UPI001ED81C24|nr:probable serine/threonine-protein kinase kinX isoform X2 [Scatophagus argus]